MMEFFFAKFERIWANWSQNSISVLQDLIENLHIDHFEVRHLNLELLPLGFYDHNVFHDADSAWFLTLWLA